MFDKNDDFFIERKGGWKILHLLDNLAVCHISRLSFAQTEAHVRRIRRSHNAQWLFLYQSYLPPTLTKIDSQYTTMEVGNRASWKGQCTQRSLSAQMNAFEWICAQVEGKGTEISQQ